ncbi:hypothetical protein [Streptomyces sp. NRRL F-5123]|uniref:hypothetical protein n=1 Tax=Streptomyces sp. NRRL F-5123 TaxID=1463856 RepID=UPI0006939425|nr:hypothetical protein [Streptomyces sp. NRRL F-5123]
MRHASSATAAMGALTGACVVLAGCGAAGTGARNEGPAPSPSTRAVSTQSAPPLALDKRALATMVRRDSSVSRDVREDLVPCGTAFSARRRASGAASGAHAGSGSGTGTGTGTGTETDPPAPAETAAPARDGTPPTTPPAEPRSGDPDDYPVSIDSGNLTAGDGPDLVVNVTTCGNGLGVAAYVYRMVKGKYQNVFADERPPVYGSVEGGQLEITHEVYEMNDPMSSPVGQESVTYAWRGGRFVQVAREYADFGSKMPTVVPEPTSTDPAPQPDSDPLDPGLPSATASQAAPSAQPTDTVTAPASVPPPTAAGE